MKSASKTYYNNLQYSIFIRIICFILRSFKNSRTCKFLNFFGEFLINSEKNSKIIRKISNFADKINKKSKKNVKSDRRDEGIFYPPLLFASVYLLILIISSYKVSFISFVIIILGILSFFVSFHLMNTEKLKFDEPSSSTCKKIALIILIPSLAALIADLYYAGKIPLFEPIARKKLSVLFTYTSTFLVLAFFILGSIYAKRGEKIKVFLIAAISTILISLLGYRTQTIVSLLGFLIIMYYYKIIRFKGVFILVIASFLSIILIGIYRISSFGAFATPISVFADRIALTLSIYDYLVLKLYYSGYAIFGYSHGYILLSTFSSFLGFIPGPRLGPRTIIAREFGVEDISMTSTLYGTVFYDYGVAGVIIFSALLGIVIGLCYNIMKKTSNPLFVALFSHTFAYLIVGIETGLVDFNVFILYSLAFFASIYFIRLEAHL